ncbi:MAG: lytic transglycosylase domain-containing protein [Melioribacteraceae bacterium]|nr:lytic transglycosylase domain-containing protein [Melioribacteraceae bacterium]
MSKIKFSSWLLAFLITGSIFALLSFSEIEKVEDKKGTDPQISAPQDYKIVCPKIPEELTFCGEEVPLYNIDVFERMEREIISNTYWHSSTLLFLKRANRWFPVIEDILEKNNVPNDFKYLALIESNLTNVVSPKGATGFWQFMKAAGKKYGLEINKLVDERYHVEKSTEAACKYLKDAYAKYGNWTLAAASYNMGTNGTSRQLERQKTTSYYNLVLSEETTRYIFRILAAKEILTNPEKYGFFVEENQLYQPYKTYTEEVKQPIEHLADWAHSKGINYKILKMFNPWLRDNYLTNKKNKTYEIKLPEEGTVEIIK